VQSASEGVEHPSFTANIAVNKRHIRRNRAHQFVLDLGWGGLVKIDREKIL
jgi:hypothetical protein